MAVAALVVGLGVEVALSRKAWAVPGAAIYATVALWYFGNVVQSGIGHLTWKFGAARVDWAFAQVAVFAVAFRFWLPVIVPRFLPKGPQVPYDPDRPMGRHEVRVAQVLGAALLLLTAVGLWRVDGDVFSVFFPPLSDSPRAMFGRSAVGSGFDFLVSVAEYTHLAVGGLLGAVAVLASRRDTRFAAAVMFVTCLMPYLFQHARHRTLAIVAPAVVAVVLVKRLPFATRAAFGVGALAAISFWFVFMTDARTGQRTWDDPFALSGGPADGRGGDLFVGLEMFDELCHIGTLTETGRYDPGFLGEYFQELVSFVPRSLWPSKPMVGFDYATARGFADPHNSGVVSVIISRGLIGQGVANCGEYLGGAVSALVAALWAGTLSRLWAQRGRPARLGLYLVGLAVTINMGRGVSFLALFPFVFAYVGVRLYEGLSPPDPRDRRGVPA